MPKARVLILTALLIVAGTPLPMAATIPAAAQEANAYTGTHVSFETSSNAVTKYTVNGEMMLATVKVQSKSNTQAQGEVRADVSLSAVTDITGAALSLGSTTDVSATITTESGAAMQAHDNSKGILVIRSGDKSQYVTATVAGSSQTQSESEKRVVVTAENGTKGTFIVVGDGTVAVNEEGNVTADLGNNGALVFRSYPEGRDADDTQQEQLITDGKAAAEVYVMQRNEGSSQLTADIVQYSEDTTVEVIQKSNGTVTMTAKRSQEQGRIIITTLSTEAINSVEKLHVTVDGEAAAKASSYSDLESAITNGQTSKFLVHQRTNATANANVLVAVNHFSTRLITMNAAEDTETTGSETTDPGTVGTAPSSEGGDGSDGGDATTSTDVPGFGVGVALLAIAAIVGFATLRRR